MENCPISWCFILGEGERKLRNETRWKDDIYCGSWRLHEFSVDNPETQIIILAVTIVATIVVTLVTIVATIVATIVTIVATIVATLVTIVATLRPSSERQVFASSLKVPGRLPTVCGSDFTWYQTCECELTISSISRNVWKQTG